MKMINNRLKVFQSALIVYLMALLLVVWTPVSEESGALLGIFRIEGNLERFLNALLLSPLPILLKLGFSRIPVSGLLATGPLLSFTIELVQRYVPGRASDLIDFALNSLGFLVVAMIEIRRSQKKFP
jgi:glycopeptide antibiotics resistance protein